MRKLSIFRRVESSAFSRQESAVTVLCPRKGPWGADISIIICDQMYLANDKLCSEHSCKKAEKHRENVRILLLMQKRKNMSHTEASRLVRLNQDLNILPDLEEFEDSEEGRENENE